MKLLEGQRKVSLMTKELPKYLLPLSCQDFLDLRLNKKPFKQFNSLEQDLHALDIVTIAHYSVGDKGENPDLLEFQKNEMLHCLKGEHGLLTVDEIKKAIDMLIAGDFGQYFGLNRKSYYQALKGFQSLPMRSEAMSKFVKLLEPKPMELSPEEKREKNKQAVIWYFKEYKKNGKLGSGSFAIYDTMWDLGLLKFSAEEKADIRKKVESKYVAEVELSRKKQQISKLQLSDILANLDTNATLKGNLRKEALKRYFDKLIKEGIELETIIE